MAHGHAEGHGSGGVGGLLKSFFLSLGLDADGASFASAEAMVHGLEKALEEVVEVAKEVGEQFVESIIGTAEYAHSIEHAAEVTQQTTDTIQQLRYVAGQTGIPIDALEGSFSHLTRTMDAARHGSVEAEMAYARLGVRVTDGSGKLRKQTDVMNDVADAIAKLPEGTERTAAAMGVLGKSGSQLLPILGNGSEALKQMMGDAEALGLVMSEESIERGARFAKGLETLKDVGQSVIHDFAEPFIEALGPVMDGLIEWVKQNREIIRTNVQNFAKGLLSVMKGIASVAAGVVDVFQRMVAVAKVLALVVGTALVAAFWANIAAIGTWIIELALANEEAILTGLAFVFMGAQAVGAAIAAAAAWLEATWPLILITVLVAGVILAFQDLFVFLRGGDSVIGHILNRYADKVEDFWNTLKSIVLPWWFPILFGNDAVDKVALRIGDAVRGDTLVSDGPTRSADFFHGGAASPSAAARLSSGANYSSSSTENSSSQNASYEQNVSINVTQQPGESAEHLAQRITEAAREENAKMLRGAAASRK